MDNLLEVQGIVKKFIHHTALSDVSLSVPTGGIFGLLGPNGAGKTTLIRIINQITAPDSGNLFFEGEKLKAKHISQIGYLPEERGLYKKMKVGEQAMYFARLKGLSKNDAQKKLVEWFEKFGIQDWWNKKVEELSKGMQQKVQFIVTILHQPKLLIFDEPFSGFDPINANLLKQEILGLRDAGSTIIFSTHNMASVEELCDNIVLLNNSKKILDGKIDEIKQTYKKNIFEIKFSGEAKEVEGKLPNQFQLLDKQQVKGNCKLQIQMPETATPNQLISAATSIGEIMAFKEVIPSMNDIFIEVVNKSKK